MVLHYLVIIVFLYFFYLNYKKISAVDNTKKLIHKILKIGGRVVIEIAFKRYVKISMIIPRIQKPLRWK